MKCKICGKEETPENYYDKAKLIKHQLCFTCNFWRERLEEDSKLPPHTACMIDGTHYIIGNENSKSSFRGFDGHRFQIEFNDGTKVITTNLWCQGEPKGYWKDKFPDNARFENNIKWKNINGINYLVHE